VVDERDRVRPGLLGAGPGRPGRPHPEAARTAESRSFRFAQDEDHDTVYEVAVGSSKLADWVPALHDYLYVSLTNSSAFSPTDTMPLTGRAKLLMGLESSSALIVSVLVISRGVGILQ
jgi:hypothetical protein